MIEKDEKQNVYAYNSELTKELHISKVERGKKGYYCLGCRREMVAVKPTKNVRAYFRHDAKAVKGQPKCTYSDETYRHQFAKEYLIKNKRVLVPALLKFPPKDVIGDPNIIRNEEVIKAFDVKSEVYFYENEYGEICSEKIPDATRNLIVKPDIVFYDSNEKPILFIELAATHKIKEDKKIKLKQLGINTIEITIPKDSEEKILEIFKTTYLTKWIYNYEQESTEYIHVPRTDGSGISVIDELQKSFFEESYKCRTTQIRELIRRLKQCLETEQYGSIAGELKSTIFRTEENTKGVTNLLGERRAEFNSRFEELRRGIDSKYAERRSRIRIEEARLEQEEARLEQEEEGFRLYCKQENARIEDLANADRERIEADIRARESDPRQRRANLDGRYIGKREELEGNIKSETGGLEQAEREEREIDDNIQTTTNSIIKSIRDIRRGRKGISEGNESEGIEARSYQQELEESEAIEARFIESRDALDSRFNQSRKELNQRFEELRRGIALAIETRTYSGNEFTEGYERTLGDLVFVPNFVAAKEYNRRIVKANECIKTKAYENWHD